MHFVDNSFSSYPWPQQIVFHEVGHNWDESYENGSIGYFRNLSGWSVENGRWIFRRGATNFVRQYGMSNAKEDFATSFAAYFMNYAGLQFQGRAVNSRDAYSSTSLSPKGTLSKITRHDLRVRWFTRSGVLTSRSASGTY